MAKTYNRDLLKLKILKPIGSFFMLKTCRSLSIEKLPRSQTTRGVPSVFYFSLSAMRRSVPVFISDYNILSCYEIRMQLPLCLFW